MIKVNVTKNGISLTNKIEENLFENNPLRDTVVRAKVKGTKKQVSEQAELIAEICSFLNSKVDGYDIKATGVNDSHYETFDDGNTIKELEFHITW